jgi:MFS family permease
VASLIWGPIIDRFGRRRTLWVSSAMFLGFSIACYFAPNITLLIIFRALQVRARGGGPGSAWFVIGETSNAARLHTCTEADGDAIGRVCKQTASPCAPHAQPNHGHSLSGQGMSVASYGVGAQAIMADTFPPHERGKAMGLLSIPLLVGPM